MDWSLSWGNSLRRRRFAAFATVSGRRNHYDVLGVPHNASSPDIKRAYRLLSLKYHPDVNKEAGANEDFKSIRLAYDVLMNDITRTEYDGALHHHHHQPSSNGPLEYENRNSRSENSWGKDQSAADKEVAEALVKWLIVLLINLAQLFLVHFSISCVCQW